MKTRLITLVAMAAILISQITVAGETKDKSAESSNKEIKAQVTCPVMGGKVSKKLYADVNGYRVYVCCKGCIAKIKADPEKYLEKIKGNGETPEKAPVKDKEGAKNEK
jgi:hypothetical protein